MNLTAERDTYYLYHATYRADYAYAYRDTYYDTYNANDREHKQLPV